MNQQKLNWENGDLAALEKIVMATKRFHMGWFMNFTPDEWRAPYGNGGRFWDGRFYVEMAQALERACFDYIMIEDKLMVPETYGGSHDYTLRNAMIAPKHDPAPLATAMGSQIRRSCWRACRRPSTVSPVAASAGTS